MSLLKYKKLSENAYTPAKGSRDAVGFDLFAIEDVDIPKMDRRVLKTGIGLEFPSGCYGRIAERSSVSEGTGLMIGGGVIDPDYRGEIKVIVINVGKYDALIRRG